MKMSVDEIFNEAIMSATPALIVEGVDDLKVYISIAKSSIIDFELYAIENVQGYAGGCDHVITAIHSLRQLDKTYAVEDYILGIIDKDVKEFRNELPADPAVLALKHYSLESHFVAEEVLEDALSRFSKSHPSSFSRALIGHLFSAVQERLSQAYYFSLEALKAATTRGYEADFTYSESYGRMQDATKRKALADKQAVLDHFAIQVGLSNTPPQLLKICKGKWLLSLFCDEIHSVLKQFKDYCGTHESRKCDYCAAGQPTRCMFQIKDGITNRTIYSSSTENVNIAGLDYIRERIRQISVATASA